jgi:hypothetical protein
MHFHVRLVDGPEGAAKRRRFVDAHWQYFDDHCDHFVARGATVADDGSVVLASVIFVEFGSWDEVRRFVANEPLNRNGTYEDVVMSRWATGLARRQRDFPRREGQVGWYIRGYGKPGVHERRQDLLQAHRDYFAPYDVAHFIARGPLLDDEGLTWRGSANLICLPTRQDVDAFMADEPYCKNGLYERVLVERYRFGGRPGQIV